jgi:hypothetical protein
MQLFLCLETHVILFYFYFAVGNTILECLKIKVQYKYNRRSFVDQQMRPKTVCLKQYFYFIYSWHLYICLSRQRLPLWIYPSRLSSMSVRPKPMSSKMSLFFFYKQFLASFVGRQNFFYYICIALLFLNILKLYFPQQNKNKIVLRASF